VVNTQRLLAFLRRHRRVGLDTGPFIYHVENHPTCGPAADRLFRTIASGPGTGITSTITMTEVLGLPYRSGRPDTADNTFATLVQMGNIEWQSPSLGIAERAARARARYNLRTLDAIQLATALAGESTGFVTNDKDFRRVTDLEVLVLDDLL
jgi:predicted nucleic acid-binding protein